MELEKMICQKDGKEKQKTIIEYMIYGAVPPCMPFADCKAFTTWEMLEDEDTVWYLSFADFRVGSLDEKYEIVDRKEIKFYYYDIVIEKYVMKESAYEK